MKYNHFLSQPVKVRILYIKKLLNVLNYNVAENFQNDKEYKKALKKFQIDNGFQGNCIVNESVFNAMQLKVPAHKTIWKEMSG